MKKIVIAILFGFLLMFGTSCSQNNERLNTQETQPLMVSAAASMSDVMTDIKTRYKSTKGATITLNFGSSGSLQRQIEQGAPADIFISASQNKMNALEDKGFIVKASRENLLQNTLVLIVPAQDAVVTEIGDLTQAKTTKFSIGEPASVPAGNYAKEALENIGIMEKLKSKMVFAKNVREVLTWVETGNVDAGMVYETDAKVSDKVIIIETIPLELYTPIVYPVAIIKESKQQESAQHFIDFLHTKEAKEVFTEYGFILTED